jgi:heptaprenyl diphosphate synthase
VQQSNNPSTHLTDGLNQLEQALAKAVISDDPFLNQVAGHLIGAGGKRLRPRLTLQAALSVRETIDERSLLGGVAVELVHLASLHHDDVMDEASSRRGVESVNARWGNLIAVVTGDYLLARAAGIAARLGKDVAELLADTLADMCQGQLLEVKSGYDLTRSPESYLHSISGKTASLMATSCRIGALVTESDDKSSDLLGELGHCVGMVFQMRDDIFDLFASEEELGKLPGQDLIEGVYTLPVILALSDASHHEELASILNDPAKVKETSAIRELLLSTSALDNSVSYINSYQRRALQLAEELDTASAHEIASLAEDLARSVDELIDRGVSPLAS